MKKGEEFEIEKISSYKTAFYSNVNSKEALQDFQNFAPDLMISIRFGQIMKSALIAIPRCGVLNLRNSAKLSWRDGKLLGNSLWREKLGTTLNYINDGTIDTGEIVAFSESEIDWNVSLTQNINNLYKNGCALISQALLQISAGEKITTISQKSLGEGRYFSYPKSADVQKFFGLMPL